MSKKALNGIDDGAAENCRPVPTASLQWADQWICFGPFAQRDRIDWKAVGDIPEVLTVGDTVYRRTSTAGRSDLDLKPLFGGAQEGKTVVVYVPFTTAEAGSFTFGFGADWWLEAILDGQPLLDTLSTGNGQWPPSCGQHCREIRLDRGRHLLAVRVISGAGGMKLCLAAGPTDGFREALNEPGVVVNFNEPAGRIKPLHGVNNSPVTYGEPLPEFRDAGIPYVRLHDTAGAFGGTYFVDIPNLFPDFDADPENPAAYDFAYTDAYLKGLTASGAKIFYRLGVTIENNWRLKPHRIYPPKDNDQWARICAGIVRHYNDGWADGFHYGIEYWEIWNEPENPPMWQGTREQYFELYRAAANHLKREFPGIKVGGYASCGFYAVNRPDMSDFYRSFVTYFDAFLKYVTAPATAAPLDFFSWHLYTTDPREIILHGDYVTKKLTEYGLTGTENIFNEWNYIDGTNPDRWDALKEMPGAVFVAAAFCLMQASSIDKAMYYDALPTRQYCGLYYFPSLKLTPAYYAFKAYNELYRLGTAVAVECRGLNDIYAAAARDDRGRGAVLIVNRNHATMTIALRASGQQGTPSCLVLDRSHQLTEAEHYLDADGRLTLPPLSVVLLRFPDRD